MAEPAGVDIVGCPQDGCDMPAERLPVTYGFGGIIHVRIFCVAGHVTLDQRRST